MRQQEKGRKAKPDKVLIVLGILWLLVAGILLASWVSQQPRIEVNWHTETEFDNVGFNVLRSEGEDGPFVQVNDHLIPSGVDPAAGGAYAYVDTDVLAGKRYFYHLEDVESDGNINRHEMVAAQAPDRPYWLLVIAATSTIVGIGLLFVGLKNEPRGK